MTNNVKSLYFILIVLLIGFLPVVAKGKNITKDGVTISYENLADHSIKLKYVENQSPRRVFIIIDGKDGPTINAESSVQIQEIAKKSVGFNTAKGSGPILWRYQPPKVVEPVQEQTTITDDKTEPLEKSAPSPESKKKETINTTVSTKSTHELPILDRINQDIFFGQEAVNTYVRKCDSFIKGLSQTSDKAQFIIDNDINTFLSVSESEIRLKRTEIPTIAQTVISSSKVSDSFINLVVETLNNRLGTREQAFRTLKSNVENIKEEPSITHSFNNKIINYGIVAAIVSVLLLWMIIILIKKKKKFRVKVQKAEVHIPTTDSGNPAIVVRRRTTSILKKQCLDDVVNNPAYLAINSSEFTPDSAIRTIYIKNTCIKEVYNLYANDLRNSENPKEDGCMVLGRWVLDEQSHTYDISLENVVFPGDDAVFKEYELNFGGKIKLRIAEKLRKLRRETNLQYDLVCWIHSHPGLGVFFSNSDDNVQMQLKHSQHPNFLIAFVVDILTSDQELGIFTFRKDGSMNSKGDLTKMYSLEDMYKWALGSDTVSFNPDNYYNILSEAKMNVTSCQGIELNNSSIIDLTQLVIESVTGIIGWAIGSSIDSTKGKEYVISSIVKHAETPTSGIMGAVINVTHFSLPTIQRLIANESERFNFVIVYSTKLMTLISIPVVNGKLITDDQYYGNETIDDLKIWTRRKR